MNTMLRNSNAPQQTALAPSMSPAGRPGGSGVPRGVWIGGGLMALTIVALATALVMKSGGSETTAQLPAAPATTLATPVPATTPAPVATATPATTTPAPVADNTTAVAPVHHTVHHTAPRATTTTTTSTTSYPDSTTNGSAGGSNVGTGTGSTSGNTQVASVPVCTSCGVVDSYSAVQVDGTNNGIGAVAGGVGGAVLGSQIAGRHNRTLGGVIGAIGGGLLGNAVESHERTTTMYDVHVRMNDGSMRTVRQATMPQVGERVTVDGSSIHAAPAQTSSNYNSGGTNYAPSGNSGSTFSPTGS